MPSQAKDIVCHYAWQLAVLLTVYAIKKCPPWWKKLRLLPRPRRITLQAAGPQGQFQLINPAKEYKANNPKWLISSIGNEPASTSIPLDPGLAAKLDRLTAPGGAAALPDFGPAARQQLFCLDPDITYLNHGSYGATFRLCCEVQGWYNQLLEAQPVKFMETVAIPGKQQGMQAIAALVGCAPGDVVPVVNATTAMNAVLQCVPLRRGDVVLVFNTTYPAVRSAAARVASAAGALLLEVQLQLDQLLSGHDQASILEVCQAAVQSVPRGRLKLACLDHIISFPPVVMPVEHMTRICKQAGALVVIDGAHAVGSLPDLNVPALGADFYTSNIHKWCCAPKGTAFLWCHPSHQSALLPLVTSHGHGLGYQGEWLWQGTGDPCAWLAVPTAIRLMTAYGLHRISQHNSQLVRDAVQLLVQRWPQHNLQVLGGGGSGPGIGMLAVSLPGLTKFPATPQGASDLHDWLRDVKSIEVPVICMSGSLWVRLSAQVDAFTEVPFSGNPAGVTLLTTGQALADDFRQKIAAEMNLAETAFVEMMPDGGDFQSGSDFILRWFTPTTEVPMCGHATLASAAVLFQEMGNTSATLNFHTKSGVLSVKRNKDGSDNQTGALLMIMSLPMSYSSTDNLPPPLNAGLDTPQAQQLIKACVGDLQVTEVAYCDTNNLNYLVIRLADGTTRQQLEGIVPDMQAMMQAANADDVHGAIVTCTGGGSGFDFLSRFFGPWLGVPEDPVTGSAHAVLGPFWSSRLHGKGSLAGVATDLTKASAVGKPIQPLKARQCSPRGGDLLVEVHDNMGHVKVTGSAVVVLKGSLMF